MLYELNIYSIANSMSTCRLCLLKLENGSSNNIFQSRINQEPLSAIITKLANVEVSENDGLSHLICFHCGAKLRDAYLFRDQIIKSDAEARQKPPVKVPVQENAEENKYSVQHNAEENPISLQEKTEEKEHRGNLITYMQMIIKDKLEAGLISQNKDPELGVDFRLGDENVELDSCKDVEPQTSRPMKKTKIHVCQECGKAFSKAARLKKHCLSHTSEKSDSCLEIQESGVDLEVDVNKNDSEPDSQGPETNEICSDGDLEPDASKNDMPPLSQQIQGRKIHNCEECGKVFKRAAGLRRHYVSHTGERPFSCDLCGQRFAFNANLKNHKRKHSDELTYRCETCGKGFKYHSSLITHQQIHFGEKRFKCDICNKAFLHKTVLEEHTYTHTAEPSFVCEYCSKPLRSKSSMAKHLKMIHFKRTTMKNCPICGKSFAHEYLRSHIMRHNAEKSFKCNICEDTFSDGSILRNHILRIHEDKKPFECEVCGKKFFVKYERFLHMRVHTKEKPFPCPVCEMAFAFRHHLRNHMNRKHLSESAVLNPTKSVVSSDENTGLSAQSVLE